MGGINRDDHEVWYDEDDLNYCECGETYRTGEDHECPPNDDPTDLPDPVFEP